ncbi:phosphatase PAP2 family protein [Alkalicoccobacillus gibsonii]|uniref:phosphatase PAP2 family protein n=1 Tax=Alkalicoccobacillus gibsonii TaxID=79881 RepID=UPI003F7B8B7D
MNHNKILLSIGSVTLSLFILLAFTYEHSFFQQLDVFIVEHVPNVRAEWITSFMLFLAWLGGTKVMAALTLILMIFLVLWQKKWTAVLPPMLIMGGTALLNMTVKEWIGRARPEINYLIEQPGYSFPSGHTMAAVSFGGLCIYLIYHYVDQKMIRILSIIVALVLFVLMGISRMYLGVHFLTDILGGTLFSITWIALAILILNRMNRHKTPDL